MKPTAARPPSLTTRAALTVMGAFGAVFAVLLALLSYQALAVGTGDVDRSLLKNAQGMARALDQVDADEAAQIAVRLFTAMVDSESSPQDPPLYLVVSRLDGSLQHADAAAPALEVWRLAAGVSVHESGGTTWRVYTARGQRWSAALLDNGSARNRAVFWEFSTDLALYLLLALPIVLVPVWLSVRSALAPLRRLSDAVAQRLPADMTPLRVATTYRELQPLEAALNQQFAQAALSIEREKAFVHDAAHELRTPLAVIAAQAHVLAQAEGPARAQARRQLEAAVQRASHLAQQLLRLAQADAVARGMRQPLDLMNLARDAIALLAASASAQGTELALLGPDHAVIDSDPQALRSIFDNLLDNALRYGGPGGTVEVHVLQVEGATQLWVTDCGPGISAAQREQVFERFWRGAGLSGQPGSGLGLAIVREAARSLGGDAHVQAGLARGAGAGCAVVVSLP